MSPWFTRRFAIAMTALIGSAALAQGAAPRPGSASAGIWVTAWIGSVQGPYPVGNPSAQPDMRFAFPVPASGARDQSFRLIVRPDVWGRQVRLRFSNALGTRPVTFDGAFVGLQRGSAAIVAGTNRPVTFGGQPGVTVPPGESVWSDAVALPFVRDPGSSAEAVALAGRRLAVSFHVAGESGPMTWHAKALNTSYVGRPGAGAVGASEDEAAFPFSTASWYFLDAVDMRAPADTRVVVAFGESLFGHGAGTGRWRGDALGLAGGVLWGLTTLAIRTTRLATASAEKTLFYQIAVTAAVTPVLSLLTGEARGLSYSAAAWGSIALQTGIGAFASYLAWMWLLRHYPATRIASFTFLTPVFALVFGVALLGEPLTLQLLLALAGVGLGVVLVNRGAPPAIAAAMPSPAAPPADIAAPATTTTRPR